jgi:hypothetical protein
MRHTVVLGVGDDVELHWQQPGLALTISEILTGPWRIVVERGPGPAPAPREAGTDFTPGPDESDGRG